MRLRDAKYFAAVIGTDNRRVLVELGDKINGDGDRDDTIQALAHWARFGFTQHSFIQCNFELEVADTDYSTLTLQSPSRQSLEHRLLLASTSKGRGQMDALTLFGLFAVTAMLVTYALEYQSPWFVLAFAGACVLGSAYGFLQGAWPFGLVEAIWAGIAARRWRKRMIDV